MRIVVNDIAASQGGALTILESFYRYVRDHDDAHEWVFLLGSELLEETAHIRTIVLPKVKRSWPRRFRFDLISGRRLIGPLKPDVVLSLQNTYTYGLQCPQVVYVHQSLPFQAARRFSLVRSDERPLAVYQHVIGAVIKQSISHADHVIVQTKWMRDAILEKVGIDGDKITSVLPEVDNTSVGTFDRTRDPRRFFYPTSDHLYKNNNCVYEACRLLRQQRMDDFTVTMTLDAQATDPNVHFIGHVPRERVMEELSQSTLIFPSYIETFGLPLVEARAMGAPVLSADLPYAREALDGYTNAYFFDADSPHQLASLMARVLRDDLPEVNPVQDLQHPQPAEGPTGWSAVAQILEESVREGARTR